MLSQHYLPIIKISKLKNASQALYEKNQRQNASFVKMLYCTKRKSIASNLSVMQKKHKLESVVKCIEKVDFRIQCCIETLSELQDVSEAEVSEAKSEPC